MPCMRLNFRNHIFCCSFMFWPFCPVFFFLLLQLVLMLSPHPHSPPPSRTKCAECGHSCWAGLPSIVRVSETPLSHVWYKWGSTLSLDFIAWFYQDMAMATNLLTWPTDWMSPGFLIILTSSSESLDFLLTKCHYCCGSCGSCDFNNLCRWSFPRNCSSKPDWPWRGWKLFGFYFALGVFAWAQFSTI